MIEAWEKKTLGEVCTLQRGFDLPKRLRIQGIIPLVSSSGYIDSHAEARVTGPGVVTGRSGSIGSVFFIEEDFWPLNTTLYVKDFHGNDPRFIFYLLKSFNLRRFASGAGVPTLNRNSVHCEPVCIPSSLPEQERIAAILDEAFAAIATATTNAEKNLTNALELFESELNRVFSQKRDAVMEGWRSLPLTECIQRVATPVKIPRKQFEDSGDFPIVSQEKNLINGYWSDASAVINVESPLVVFGDHTKILKYIDFDFVVGADGVKLLQPKPFVRAKFFYYFLMANPITALGYARHYRLLKELVIRFPESLREQERIMARLDKLSAKKQSLVGHFEQKANALTQLKQSILHKAFTGELTADWKAAERTLSENGA